MSPEAKAAARGYAIGFQDGYVRGVEEAKQLIGHYGLTVAEVVEALDALLKPKGGAK